MSSKPELVFCGPVATVSGYGSHARDLVSSLIKMDKYNIKIISINWGETPMNALDKNNEEHQEILNRIAKEQLNSQPDIWVQCTIPTEFQPVGKYNIGITAGIETNVCSPEWVEGCNRMDIILVPSKHAKDVFINSVYERRDKNTSEVIDMHKITKPIEVLHEGVRTDLFGKDAKQNEIVKKSLDEIKEDFVFLFVGHWLKGDFGQDRKDVSGLIYTFLKTFAGKQNAPALLLKTSMGTFSITGRNTIIDKINEIKKMLNLKNPPSIYLLNGDLDETDMNTLYHHDKVKSFISFTKGEGYGRPIAEFMTTGKPIIVPRWSGHLDFIENDVNVLLDGELKEVHDSAIWETVINKGSRWFTVDYNKAAEKMQDVFSKYNIFLKKSKLSLISMKTKWSYNKMHERFEKIMDTNVPKFAVKSEIKLPKLNKISD